MTLETELEFYDVHVEEWKQDRAGQFVVIRGVEVLGFFATESDALSAGAGTYGAVPFLVRKVGEPVQELNIPAYTLGLIGARS